ncbi:MAG: hypothetical protein ACLVHV_02600 [Oscillospiraceae bacterium]
MRVQRITTAEPKDDMTRVAIQALEGGDSAGERRGISFRRVQLRDAENSMTAREVNCFSGKKQARVG